MLINIILSNQNVKSPTFCGNKIDLLIKAIQQICFTIFNYHVLSAMTKSISAHLTSPLIKGKKYQSIIVYNK